MSHLVKQKVCPWGLEREWLVRTKRDSTCMEEEPNNPRFGIRQKHEIDMEFGELDPGDYQIQIIKVSNNVFHTLSAICAARIIFDSEGTSMSQSNLAIDSLEKTTNSFKESVFARNSVIEFLDSRGIDVSIVPMEEKVHWMETAIRVLLNGSAICYVPGIHASIVTFVRIQPKSALSCRLTTLIDGTSSFNDMWHSVTMRAVRFDSSY